MFKMSAETFEAFDAYPYDQDAEFKLGLESIMQHAQNADHAQQLEKQARSFYFKRKTGQIIDLAAYSAWKESEDNKGKAPATHNGVSPPKTEEAPSEIEKSIASASILSTTAGGDGSETRMSYQQIVDMIKDGKEDDLPGVRDIPDTVLEGQGTTSTQAQRRKPWEKDESSSEPLSTFA